MILEGIGNVMAWSILGFVICLGLIITLAVYWLTRE